MDERGATARRSRSAFWGATSWNRTRSAREGVHAHSGTPGFRTSRNGACAGMGPAIRTDEDHREPTSTGSSKEGERSRAKQRKLIEDGRLGQSREDGHEVPGRAGEGGWKIDCEILK